MEFLLDRCILVFSLSLFALGADAMVFEGLKASHDKVRAAYVFCARQSSPLALLAEIVGRIGGTDRWPHTARGVRRRT